MIGPEAEVEHDASATVSLIVTAPFMVHRNVVLEELVLENIPPVAVQT